MSEYITKCPKCNQRILGDTIYSGQRVACPLCLQEITLPEFVQPKPDELRAPTPMRVSITDRPPGSKPSRWPAVMAAIGAVLLIAVGVIWWLKGAPLKTVSAPAAGDSSRQISAEARRITWLPPAPITTAEATLLLRGEVVNAVGFGLAKPRTVTLANLKITFAAASATNVASTTGTSSTGFDQWGASASFSSTGNRDFDAVLNGFNYDGGPKTITIYHLIPGRQYAAQLFALDNRSLKDAKHRVAWFSDPLDPADVSATFKMGDDVYVVGIFTATSDSRQIIENLPGTASDTEGGVGNINALIVRLLP